MNNVGLVSAISFAEKIAEENRPEVGFVQADARDYGGIRLFVHRKAGQSFIIDLPAGDITPFNPFSDHCFSSC